MDQLPNYRAKNLRTKMKNLFFDIFSFSVLTIFTNFTESLLHNIKKSREGSQKILIQLERYLERNMSRRRLKRTHVSAAQATIKYGWSTAAIRSLAGPTEQPEISLRMFVKYQQICEAPYFTLPPTDPALSYLYGMGGFRGAVAAATSGGAATVSNKTWVIFTGSRKDIQTVRTVCWTLFQIIFFIGSSVFTQTNNIIILVSKEMRDLIYKTINFSSLYPTGVISLYKHIVGCENGPFLWILTVPRSLKVWHKVTLKALNAHHRQYSPKKGTLNQKSGQMGKTRKSQSPKTNIKGSKGGLIWQAQESNLVTKSAEMAKIKIHNDPILNFQDDDFTPFEIPIGLFERIYWGLSLPLVALHYYTTPDIRISKWRKWYIVTFILSMLWIAAYSYIMVWMITVIGFTFGIPDTVMGLTFVAVGVSVPDALSSLAVAKQGFGDMAVSNAIGSNVFDILLCLGLPWFLKTAIVDPGSVVLVESRGLTYSTCSLFSTVVFLVVATHWNGWKLDPKYGVALMFWYLLFMVLACLYESNLFGVFNLPSCTSKY
ncbi:unnamed protein product, partial [Meganyctiphanes norvegica]